MQPTIGRTFTDILFSSKAGQVNARRDHVLVGKERHDIGRPNDVGYPIRGIHKNDWLYVHNYEIDRWPAGNPETGYLNCDGGVTKTWILQARRDGLEKRHWQLAFGKRPAEEMYDVKNDPDCLNNLANDPKYKTQKRTLQQQMERELKAQGDPRMFGKGDLFDKYEYANPAQLHFYERFMRGEKPKAGWVNESDFEKEPIKE